MHDLRKGFLRLPTFEISSPSYSLQKPLHSSHQSFPMCDTLVVPPSHTATGKMIFAKNSDREPNEAQVLEHFPRTDPTSIKVKCTYIEIPQAKETFEVILSKPKWMWGAEMGVNEYGVAIGNEAVFTKIGFDKSNNGLTGMDLLRLALERSANAVLAIETITTLLEKFGQDACGGFENKNFFYHNSFLIADPNEAWVLETAGKHWVAQNATGPRTISNGLTIGEHYDFVSKGSIDFARKNGWIKKGEPFHFAKAFTAKFMTWASGCAVRQIITSRSSCQERFTMMDAANILSSHFNPKNFAPHKSSTNDVCMHATGITCPNQTTGSMIAELHNKGQSKIWATGTSNPCLSLFKPLYFGDPFVQSDIIKEGNFWQRAEHFHRFAAKDYSTIKKFCQDHIQCKQQEHIDGCYTKSISTNQAFEFHLTKIEEGIKELEKLRSKNFAPLYSIYWGRQNAKMPSIH
jgi:secernin